MPLGWYFAEQWRRFEGNNWIQEHCDRFIKRDRILKKFTNELPMVKAISSSCVLDQYLQFLLFFMLVPMSLTTGSCRSREICSGFRMRFRLIN